MITIIDYQPKFKETFKALSLEWISKHFELIDHDLDILADPEAKILNPGGEIIFAVLNDEIVGTAALCKKSEERYELAKLGVTESAKGQGIGKLLIEEIISRARKRKAQYLFLESNRVLGPAINLYKKLGFIEINPETKTPQCDIEMSLRL